MPKFFTSAPNTHSPQSPNSKQLEVSYLAWQDFWYSPLGKKILQLETQLIQPRLEVIQGYHLLNLSSFASPNTLLDASPIKHQINWQPLLAEQIPLTLTSSNKQQSQFISQLDALPLPESSQDLVILHHCLELATNPQQLLAEAARVVLPKGEILLFGFNPFCLLTASRFLPEFMPSWLPQVGNAEAIQAFKLSQLVSLNQLTSWLEAANLHLEEKHLARHLTPDKTHTADQSSSWLAKQLNQHLPGASIYCLRLQKRLGSPIKPKLSYTSARWLPNGAAASPTRNSLRDKSC